MKTDRECGPCEFKDDRNPLICAVCRREKTTMRKTLIDRNPELGAIG